MKLYEIYKEFPFICTDNRHCRPNSIFFALKGERFDANAFALSALGNGCTRAVVDNPKYAIDERFILVDSVLDTLQQLARYHRQQLKTTVIGITGTNGKTTTKELIASVLSQKFNVLYTQGNLNNHIGVPLTLLQLKSEHQVAVIEMGANHRGEIKTLAEIALPDYGIITNVGKAHLEGFGSFQGVMDAKAELYDYICSNGGKIFINSANSYLLGMADKSGIDLQQSAFHYELNTNAKHKAATGKIISCDPLLNMQCQTSHNEFTINTQLIGAYNAENVLAAVAIGSYFGVADKQIKYGIEQYKPANNRSQLVTTKHNKLIVDAYNANPTSMQTAISNFAAIKHENKVLIIGDMLELGAQSDEEHQKIIDWINEMDFSSVYLVGNHLLATKHNFCAYTDVAELKEALSNTPLKDHLILIKGSRGIHLEDVIEKL